MDSDARIKINGFLIQKCEILVENSMTEIKPVVMEKSEIEYRDEALIVALFGTFGFS